MNLIISGGEAETVAYAAHCQQEAELDRPIAGHTNICPQALNSTKIEVNQKPSVHLQHENQTRFAVYVFIFFKLQTQRGQSGT